MEYSGNPKDFRWADPDLADTAGQRELIVAIVNLIEQVMRLADVAEDREAREENR